MITRLLTGTARDFAWRIPLTFYPLMALCAVGLVLDPPLNWRVAIKLAVMALFLAGLLLRLWGSALLTSAVVVDRATHADHLIATGPFALMRHPLYTGAGCMFLALVLPLQPYLVIPFLLYEGVVSLRLARHEEQLMHARFGGDYADYRRHTGRYLPLPWKFGRTAWRDLLHIGSPRSAMLSEFVFILYGACLAAGLVFDSSRLLFGGILVASFGGGWMVRKLAPRARV